MAQRTGILFSSFGKRVRERHLVGGELRDRTEVLPARCQAVALDLKLRGTRWLYGLEVGPRDVSVTFVSRLFRTKDTWARRGRIA